jgi:hypothetical protein
VWTQQEERKRGREGGRKERPINKYTEQLYSGCDIIYRDRKISRSQWKLPVKWGAGHSSIILKYSNHTTRNATQTTLQFYSNIKFVNLYLTDAILINFKEEEHNENRCCWTQRIKTSVAEQRESKPLFLNTKNENICCWTWTIKTSFAEQEESKPLMLNTKNQDYVAESHCRTRSSGCNIGFVQVSSEAIFRFYCALPRLVPYNYISM